MITIKEPSWFKENDRYWKSEAVQFGINVKFADHVATVLLDNDDFFIVSWRNKNGSGDYAVRYIVDRKNGAFIVYGDIGDSVAKWYSALRPDELATYICDIFYYTEKIKTDNIYSYDIKLAKKELVEELDEERQTRTEEECEPENIREIEEDYNRMINMLYDIDYSACSEEFLELWDKYHIDEDPGQLGQYIKPWVFLWAAGYILACEQLGLIKIER